MAKLAATVQEAPVIEWDEDVLDIVEPYFLFFLRWSSMNTAKLLLPISLTTHRPQRCPTQCSHITASDNLVLERWRPAVAKSARGLGAPA